MALLSALGHIANLGQFVEIGQGHAHQREQVRWSRRNFALDTQALKIDLLGAARDDVRGTYDTYVERLDALLLLNALILPFALNTLQFSDQFVPGMDCIQNAASDHHDAAVYCIVVAHPWMHTFWVYLVALDLFLPFWAILLLLQCKRRLDSWLQATLEDLQNLRKGIITQPPSGDAGGGESRKQLEEQLAEDQQRTIAYLSGFIVDYQDEFMLHWHGRCYPLVTWATRLLWSSTTVAIALTAYMFWIYLADKNDYFTGDSDHFAVLSILGFLLPLVYFARYAFCCRPPPAGVTPQPVTMAREISIRSFPTQSSTPSGRLPLLPGDTIRTPPASLVDDYGRRQAAVSR